MFKALGAAMAATGFIGVGYNRPLSYETAILSALRGALGLVLLVAGIVLFFIEPAFAQASSSAPDSSVVTVSVAEHLNPILEFIQVLLEAATGGLILLLMRFLPGWLRPLITAQVQAAITVFIRQGIAWGIQEVESFDKDKVISFDVGNAGVASALRYVLDHAPEWLVNLAGGKDAIAAKIVAFLTEHGIVLDKDVDPTAVATTAAKSVAG